MRHFRKLRFAVSILLGFSLATVVSKSYSADTPALQFRERTLAGTSKDLMIVRYMRLAGTNEQIGAKLAEVARIRHGTTGFVSQEKAALAQLAWLKTNWPEMASRAEGVASYLGKKPGSDGFDPSALGYNLDLNVGCSVVFYPPANVTNGHAMLSRNYDFPTGTFAKFVGAPPVEGARSMTGDPYLIEMRPDKGYASLYMGSYDLLGGCIDGMNEKGVAVALLADDVSPNKQPSLNIGLRELTLTRYVLDRCATAKEARSLLANLPYHYMFIPCHYIICDARGDSFVWEVTADGKQRFIVDGKGKPQIATNHLLSKFGTENLPEGNSFDRFRRLTSEVSSRKAKVTPIEVLTINHCVAVPKEASDAATLWHSVYDLKDRKVKISFFLGRDAKGNDRRTPYMEFGFTK